MRGRWRKRKGNRGDGIRKEKRQGETRGRRSGRGRSRRVRKEECKERRWEVEGGRKRVQKRGKGRRGNDGGSTGKEEEAGKAQKEWK